MLKRAESMVAGTLVIFGADGAPAAENASPLVVACSCAILSRANPNRARRVKECNTMSDSKRSNNSVRAGERT